MDNLTISLESEYICALHVLDFDFFLYFLKHLL